ncbi:MAG: ERCC4 domain-containing protein [Planctomycetota bacterium]|nr:ERCC4 domain-containing protein [Planctomycetota bacterium]
MAEPKPTIIIDTREQHPWSFANLPTERATLDSGDYSIVGLTHLVVVERKSLPDLLTCIGRERDRFKRELQRLRAYRFRCLVAEASYADLERGEWRSQLKPSHVLGSLIAWMAQYSLPVMLAGDHQAAARFAERYLFQAARCVAQENGALGVTAECVA